MVNGECGVHTEITKGCESFANGAQLSVLLRLCEKKFAEQSRATNHTNQHEHKRDKTSNSTNEYECTRII